MTQYGDMILVSIGPGNGWMMPQAITCTNVDFSFVKFCDIHIKIISQRVPSYYSVYQYIEKSYMCQSPMLWESQGSVRTKLSATVDFSRMTMLTYCSLSESSITAIKVEGTEWLLFVPSTCSKPWPGCDASIGWYSYTRPRVGSLFWYTETRRHAYK